MVMWMMSRMERKRIKRKFKRFLRICIFVQIILLICGLLIVDFQIRTTLGIDEAGLISFKRIGDGKYAVHIMGNSHSIDISAIKLQTCDRFAQLREMTYSISEWVEQRLKNASY